MLVARTAQHPLSDLDEFWQALMPARRALAGRIQSVSGGFAHADIVEDDQAYSVEIDVPQVRKEDLQVRIEQRVLTVQGKREPASLPEGAKALVNERPRGVFERRFLLPEGVQADRIEARLEAGVLSLRIPKAAQAQPRLLDIQVA